MSLEHKRQINDLQRRVEALQAVIDKAWIRQGMPLTKGGGGTNIKIFEVQSDRTDLGDGIYKCYEQKLIDAEWIGVEGNNKFEDAEETPTEVEVFNLNESDVEADYSPALALYDLIAAWQIRDDEGNNRWVGVPLVGPDREAIATEDAPAQTSITCNLILRNGAEAAEDELGYHIEVYAKLFGGGVTISACVPEIFEDDPVHVINLQGKWYCVWWYNAYVECQYPAE